MRKVLVAFALLAGLGGASAQLFQTINGKPVTIGATATQVAAFRTRNAITLTVPVGGVDVYIGSSNAVTTSTGFDIAPGGSLTLQPYSGPVWGVVTTGTQTLNVAETF